MTKTELDAFIDTFPEPIRKALDTATWGTVDGDHHKMWVIDQIVRNLTGDKYDEFVRLIKNGEDGPETYDWDKGIAP